MSIYNENSTQNTHNTHSKTNRKLFTGKQVNAAIAAALLFGLAAQGTIGTITKPAEAAQTAAPPAFSDPAFQQVWQRTDLPVMNAGVARAWTWGPQGFYTTYEAYAEGPGGQHLVTYFDKSRMEINAPAGDRNSEWYVTNGLLVVDMIKGVLQQGNNSFAPYHPNTVPVAGDVPASVNAPTYASLAKVASLNNDNRAANRTGQAVMEGLSKDGAVSLLQNLSGYSHYAQYEPTLGHNIPDVFWSFLNSKGPVYENGQYVNGTVVDWLFAMGYPITEPYWINISVGGQQRWVLMQAFQRRILTYTPTNADAWKVEMANVGRAYFDWRYSSQNPPTPAPVPSATPAPVTKAVLSISPTAGDTNTAITVSGSGFPAKANVTLIMQNASAAYAREVGHATANNSGAFTTQIQVPADAGKFGAVTVVAVSGNISATQSYTLSYNPSISVTPNVWVLSGAMLKVRGQGFPPRISVSVGVLFNGSGKVEQLTKATTSDKGSFEASLGIGTRPAGSQFTVIVMGEDNIKATAGKITVYAAAPTPPPASYTLSIGSATLGVGQQLVVTGAGWGSNHYVRLGLGYTQVQEWVSQPTVDAQGNFRATFTLDSTWQNAGQITLFAVGRENGHVTTANLTVTPSARVVPSGLAIAVTSYQLANNTVVYKLRGTGWQANRAVNAQVFTIDGTVKATVANVAVKPDGTLAFQFSAASPWYGRTDLGVRILGADNAVLSVRYLPKVVMDQPAAGSKTYSFRARNLPANTLVEVVAHIDGKDSQIATATTDANGALNLSVALPKIPSNGDNGVELRTVDGQYGGFFYF